MYNTEALNDVFKNQVGFFQYFNPNYNVPSSLSISKSGNYVEQAHPLCSLENILQASPEFDNFEYPDWIEGNIYNIKSIVKYGISDGNIRFFISNKRTNQNPEDVDWNEYNPFEDYMTKIYQAGTLELVQDLSRIKSIDETSKKLLDSLRLYDGLGSLNQRIVKRGRFVGLIIKVNNQEGLTAKLNQIGMQLDTAQELDIYVYAAGNNQPIIQQTCTFTESGTFSWADLENVFLSYISLNKFSNGSFFIGYYEDDLIGQAVKRDTTNWIKAPCSGCSEWNSWSYKNWSRHFQITSFEINATDFAANNYDRISYDATNNWGINLSITLLCDVTAFFMKNKEILSNALSFKLALKLLSVIAFTTRMNVISDKTRALAMAELSSKDKDSFLNKYLSELEALNFDFSALSSDCLTETKRKNIYYGSV